MKNVLFKRKSLAPAIALKFDEKKHLWNSRFCLIAFCIIIRNGTDETASLIKNCYNFEGGAFLVVFVISMFLFALPTVYMELFIGTYSKSTPAELWRMAPIAYGFSIYILLTTITHPISNVIYMYTYIDWSYKLYRNITVVWDVCSSEGEYDCYDFLKRGPINSTKCDFIFPMMIKCEGMPKMIQFSAANFYWTQYLTSVHSEKIFSQRGFAVLLMVWGFTCFSLIKGLKFIGKLAVLALVILYARVCTYDLFILLTSGAQDGIRYLVTVTMHKFLDLQLYMSAFVALWKMGFAVPTVYMTIAAHSTLNPSDVWLDAILITLGNTVGCIVSLIRWGAASGIIAGRLGVEPYAVYVGFRGIHTALLTELGRTMRMPEFIFYVQFVFGIFIDLSQHVFYIYIYILNVLSFFPPTKPFKRYICCVVCFVGFSLSSLLTNRYGITFLIPCLYTHWTKTVFEIGVTVETIVVFWIYGESRLADDVHFTVKTPAALFWRVTWRIIPLFTFVSLIMRFSLGLEGTHFFNKEIIVCPKNIKTIRFWLVACFAAVIPIMGIYEIFTAWKNNNIWYVFKPVSHWGPPKRRQRTLRKLFDPRKDIVSQKPRFCVLQHNHKLTEEVISLEGSAESTKNFDSFVLEKINLT